MSEPPPTATKAPDHSHRTVARRAGIVGLGTFASRILGLVRESVLMALFPKDVVDAFQVAFMIPNSFRRLTAEGSFSVAVTSVFSKIWAKGDKAEAERFVGALFGFALVFLAVLAVAGVVFAEQLTWLAGSGFEKHPGKFELAVSLTRWMFPYVLLVSLMSVMMGLLNAAGRFFAPAFAPVLLNVALIACPLTLVGVMPRFGFSPIFSVVTGVLLGGVAQLVFQMPALRGAGLLVRPRLTLRNPELVRVLKMTGPMVFGAAAYQIGLFISNSLASSLGDGSVMYIQAASRLLELPLAVLVMAISTAALPSLAALRGRGEMRAMKETFRRALSLALFVSAPAMIALVVLAEPVVAILFQRGHFTYAETLQTAAAVRWQAAGMCSIALLRQTVPMFYALENTRVPVLMSGLYILAYVTAALPLMGPFGHQGLSMALSVAATAQGLGLVIVLRVKVGRLGGRQTLLGFGKMLLATVPMAAASYGVTLLGRWTDGGNSPRNIVVLALSIGIGASVYAAAAWMLRITELRELVDGLRRRLRRKTV